MAVETAEPPVGTQAPPARDTRGETAGTRMGDKFRAEFAKLEGKKEPEPKTDPVAKEENLSPIGDKTKVDPLDIASGDRKVEPAAAPPTDENEWEKSDAIKDLPAFDAKAENQRKNWDIARRRIVEKDTEVQRLSKEIEAARNGGATSAELQAARQELEAAKQRIAEQEQSIKAVGAEYSQEYQDLVKGHRNAQDKVVKRFEAFAGKGTGDALADALAMPQGRMRTDAIKAALTADGIDNDDRVELRALITRADEVREQIDDFRKDLPGKFEEISAKRAEAERLNAEKSLKQIDADFGKVVQTLPDSNVFLRFIPDNAPDAATWNGAIRKAHETALQHLKPGQTFDSSAALLVKGADYDRVMTYALEMRKRALDAEARNQETDSAAPDFKGGTKRAPEQPKTGPEKYHEYMAKHAAGAQVE